MILGFAHLAINTENLLQAEEKWRKYGYRRKAMHINVPNHSSKGAFSRTSPTRHDLMLLDGSGLWPLELTCHGPARGLNTQITWASDSIQIKLNDLVPLQRFLQNGLGFVPWNEGTLRLKSLLPGWLCQICLNVGESEPVQLDAAGPTCLAFYSNRIEEDALRLCSLGGTDFSGIFDLVLGQQTMSIALMRAPGGPLLELISLKIRKNS